MTHFIGFDKLLMSELKTRNFHVRCIVQESDWTFESWTKENKFWAKSIINLKNEQAYYRILSAYILLIFIEKNLLLASYETSKLQQLLSYLKNLIRKYLATASMASMEWISEYKEIKSFFLLKFNFADFYLLFEELT